MAYTPTKGSPEPDVPGENVVEGAIAAVETLVAKIPASAALDGEIAVVEAAIASVMAEIDPDGQKGPERTLLLDTAYAQGAAGLPTLQAFATDVPAHPTPWVHRARWMCVQLGAADPLPNGP
jgi:hypothetical protein